MRTFFTLIIVTCISSIVYSQAYQPFPTSNAMWREQSYGFQCSCCADFQYTNDGDTIVNMNTYHKLLKSGVRYQEDLMGGCTTNISEIIHEFAGCFRNDSLNKLVYYIAPFTSNETVLYDFNLTVGDTIPPSLLNENGTIVNVVANIDTVFLGGVYRKRFIIDSCFQQLYYIEGIGSTYGLLSPTRCPFEQVYTLQCFKSNSLPVYPDNTTNCSPATANNVSLEINQFSISPNPSSDALFINTNLNCYDICIMNSIGQLILQKNMNSQSCVLDISHLPSGIFLITFSDQNKILHQESIIRQ